MFARSAVQFHAMRVATSQGSKAEAKARSKGGVLPAALAPGFPATPSHDLVFHQGRTLASLSFFNFFVGGQSAWKKNDVDNINGALAAAMSDKNLNNVMQQYFNSSITSRHLGSKILAGPAPAVVSQGDIEALVASLFTTGKLNTPDFGSTVFNLMLPSKTVLNDDPGVTNGTIAMHFEGEEQPNRAIPAPDEGDSTGGLGGYHGSVHVNGNLVLYAVGVFSEVLPDGTRNGIPVFDLPWKNVVATFYHELNEARTDPDVEEANRTGSIEVLGWTSRDGEECGDYPVFEAKPLTRVFREVPLAIGNGSVPVQFQYSNAVHGPEGPISAPH